jgi:hypothetical protein
VTASTFPAKNSCSQIKSGPELLSEYEALGDKPPRVLQMHQLYDAALLLEKHIGSIPYPLLGLLLELRDLEAREANGAQNVKLERATVEIRCAAVAAVKLLEAEPTFKPAVHNPSNRTSAARKWVAEVIGEKPSDLREWSQTWAKRRTSWPVDAANRIAFHKTELLKAIADRPDGSPNGYLEALQGCLRSVAALRDTTRLYSSPDEKFR